ncbi:MAG: hypothetical protein QW484_03075 [Candidatus Pacearchaeota archaeon]
MKNKLGLFFVMALVAIFAVTTVLADSWQEPSMPDIKEMTVYVEGNAVWHGFCYQYSWPPYDPTIPTTEATIVRWRCYTYQYSTPALERDSQLSVKVVFKSNKDLSNVKLHVWLNGYREEIEARTTEFDVFRGNLYSKTLVLDIPHDIDARVLYTLYAKIESNHELTGVDEAKIDMSVQRIANVLDILSIDLYDHQNYYRGVCGQCTSTFNAGSTLYVDVVVKNRGNHKAEDVYLKVSIPELGISRNVYVGDIEAYDGYGKVEDTEKVTIALPLPNTEGTYTLEIKAYNTEVSDKETRTIVVEKQLERNIQIMPQITEVKSNKGSTATYSLFITNIGETSENFIIEVLGTEGWATATVVPATFRLNSGESKIVTINLEIDKDAESRIYPFTVRVKYGNEAKQYNFSANVSGTAFDWKIFLMIVGIVLAVVIIVLLVITLIKQNKTTEEKPELESYY